MMFILICRFCFKFLSLYRLFLHFRSLDKTERSRYHSHQERECYEYK